MEAGTSEQDMLHVPDAAGPHAPERATEQQPDVAQDASASEAPELAARARDMAKGTQEQEERGKEQQKVAELEAANQHAAQSQASDQQSESQRRVCTPDSQLQAAGGGRADEEETSGDVATQEQGLQCTPGAPDAVQAHDDTFPAHEAAPNAHQRALLNIGRGMSRPVSGATSRPPSRGAVTAAPRSAAHSRPASGRAR